MNIHNIYAIFMKYFRTKRLSEFSKLFPEHTCKRIIDLGGTTYQWDHLCYKSEVTILNLDVHKKIKGPDRYHFVQGDACNTGYPGKSFDLAFSNSVIEHVGDWNAQKKFAQEMLRIGKRIYLQTPNKRFFVEPHLIAPFIHYLPQKWALPLVRYFTVYGLVTKPTRKQAELFLSSIRLLGKRELKELFPGCDILTERFLFMAKSYIVVKR